MDFDTIFPIVLIVVYLLVQVLSGKKKKARKQGTTQPRPAGEVRSNRPKELDDALREIQRSLGMPVEERRPPAPRPEPAPVPSYEQTIPSPAASKPAPIRSTSEYEPPAIHGSALAESAMLASIEEAYAREARRETTRVPAARALLSRRDDLRRAVILHEILSPPKAMRRR